MPMVARSSRRRRLRVGLVGLTVAVLAVELVLARPYLTRAAGTLRDPDARWLAVALLAELLSMGAFAHVQRRMLLAGGARISMIRLLALTYAANAVSVTLPGGTALSTGYTITRLRRWGASIPLASFTLIASGVLSLVSFGLLGLAGGVAAGAQATGPIELAVAVLLLATVVLGARKLRRRPDLAVRVGEWGLARANRLRRRPAESGRARIASFVAEIGEIHPRHRDWTAGLAWAALNWVADLICLIASCWAVGAHGATIELAVVAYVAGTAAASVTFLPGGLGVVDAAMILALVHGGLSPVTATAGVLLYRLISFVFIVAVGWLSWVGTWGLDRQRARREARAGLA